ncbi:hypothetical protein H6P81_017616 [Aristolochia fimbriata]|uniref:Late embryogenesis abundant protein LEA-2 subgroup domain-containing protein n=1 Tax=Aristolochia fimbriata TaxID=158543 RepID=A0AAV7E2Z3_ARIFI|nr:hypothetical protein H6P81_017616 [Aristolochia fimbriata]
MAPPVAEAPPPTTPKRSSLLKKVIIFIIAMIVVHGLMVLFAWLIIKPRPLLYTVEDGSLHGFSLANDSLNATFDVTLRLDNRNRRMSLYYSSLDVSIWFRGQMLAFDQTGAFHQRRRNSTLIEVKPEARSLRLMRDVADALNRQKKSGNVKLDVRVRARLRFKLLMFKTWGYHLKAYCSPVVMHLDPKKWFKRTPCDVDL